MYMRCYKQFIFYMGRKINLIFNFYSNIASEHNDGLNIKIVGMHEA